MSQSLNILQTCFSSSWGGLEMQALEVTKQLYNRKHDVWLACTKGSKLEHEAKAVGIKVLSLNVSGYFHPLVIAKLARFLSKESIDIIHCQHSKDISTLVPTKILSQKKCPIILSKRVGSYISKKDLFHRFTYSHIDRVLAISNVIRKNVIETTPIHPERVQVLHDAVDTDLFSIGKINRVEIRNGLGFTNDHIVVGFVGRFSPGKGHEEFLNAAALLKNRYSNLRFVIVGEASFREKAYEENIRTMCKSLKLEEVVHFTGYRKDIPELMASFDIFAFPSHAEAFGVVLIEAMAMERPVVSTNCDGVLDIVVDGTTGIFVNPQNAQQLADALEKLCNDANLRHSMGKAGRKRVEESFSQREQIAKLEEIYNNTILNNIK